MVTSDSVLIGCTQVGAVANMSALLMKQMLEDAEQQGAAVTFDTSSVEDQGEWECVQYANTRGGRFCLFVRMSIALALVFAAERFYCNPTVTIPSKRKIPVLFARRFPSIGRDTRAQHSDEYALWLSNSHVVQKDRDFDEHERARSR